MPAAPSAANWGYRDFRTCCGLHPSRFQLVLSTLSCPRAFLRPPSPPPDRPLFSLTRFQKLPFLDPSGGSINLASPTLLTWV